MFNETNETNEPVLTPGEWVREFAGGAAIMGAWLLVMWAMAV